jgi:hypothetical protein
MGAFCIEIWPRVSRGEMNNWLLYLGRGKWVHSEQRWGRVISGGGANGWILYLEMGAFCSETVEGYLEWGECLGSVL